MRCEHPRTVEIDGDRPDYRVDIAVDRATGLILRLMERTGDETTRDAEVVDITPDAPLAPTAFDFVFPTGTTMLY